MSKIRTFNKTVALEPVDFNLKTKTSTSGSGKIDMSALIVKDLLSTKVMFDSPNFNAGDTVYFNADKQALQMFTKTQAITVDGQQIKFILVNEDMIDLVVKA